MKLNYQTVKLARKFGIQVRRISKVQNGVYRLTLPEGRTVGLKRMPVSRNNLRWIDHSLQAVRRNGYKKIGWRNPQTREGQRLFTQLHQDGALHILIPWISGRWPSVHSSKDMWACGAALAHFHKAARRFRATSSGAVNMVGMWPITLRAEHLMMAKLVAEASSKYSLRPMDQFLQDHGKEILGYSNQALQLLRKHGYQTICRTRRHLISLCHGDGGPTNFILNDKGVHLIDFETLRMDLRAYDLYRVIYNSCKDHSWKFTIARTFLDGYQSVYTLERADFVMLRALLRFPRTTYLNLRRYRRTNTQGKSLMLKEITRSLASERKIAAFFSQLDRYYRAQN